MYSKELFKPGSNNIFVFGSNLRGLHGKGAALFAKDHCGAIYGKAVGIQGNSYAIPTKDHSLKSLFLVDIKAFVSQFLHYADANRHLTFYVTRIGCGLAGYKDEDISPLFKNHPTNCILPNEWKSSPCDYCGKPVAYPLPVHKKCAFKWLEEDYARTK